MERNLSIFERNYDLFMEKFPKLALLLSISDALPPQEETLPLISLKEIDLLYFYGIGRGEPYFAVKDWLHEKKERRLIILSDDFSDFLQTERAEEILLDPQVLLDLPSEIDALAQQFPLSRIEMLSLPSKRSKKFHALRLQLLRKTTLSHALHIDRLHGDQPFINFIKNLKQLPLSFYANGLKGRFANIPAVVCGAGPSLQEAMPHLKKLEEKALLIAGGSTLAALSAGGVVPHFGMAIDPNLEELRRLKNSFAFEVPLLYSTRLFPDVFQTCNGPFGYMRSGIGGLLELWIEEALGLSDPLLGEHLSPESLSVTTICVAFAQFLGCNPIVLSGVDLAYTDRKHYALGVSNDESIEWDALDASDRMIKRKDRRGKPIFTAVRWVMESSSLSYFAKMHPEVRFINATEGGIEIKRMKYQPLEQIEKKLPMQDLRAKVQKAVFQSPMPVNSSKIIDEKIKELFASLHRLVAHLEVLAKRESPLDELELVEEMAYSYLFYDVHQLLEKEIHLFPFFPKDRQARSQEKWRRFLHLAKKHAAVERFL
jgi:hypothetical protein